MKRNFLIVLIFLNIYGIISVFSDGYDKNIYEVSQTNTSGYNVSQINNDDFIYIANFLELAKIGRHDDFPAYRNYRLKNDINLPFVAYSRELVRSGEVLPLYSCPDELYQLNILIPDYFRHYYVSDAPLNNVARGWKPIPKFSGIFDGAGHTISGLAGDRLRHRYPITSGREQMGGLFGAVTGTIKNLTVEVGQKFRSPHDLALTNMGHGARVGALNLIAYGGKWSQTPNETSHYIPGVGHVGGVGSIAAILHGGTIYNSYAKSLIQEGSVRDSSIRARQRNFGGLVGLIVDGRVINSSTSVRMEASNQETGNTGHNGAGWSAGGFAGTIQGDSLIKNSSTYSYFDRLGNLVGGFVGEITGSSKIINSYSNTAFNMTGSDTSGDHTTVAGFAQSVQGNARIMNSFTTTQRHRSGNRLFDGFAVSVSNNAVITNVVATAPTGSGRGIHIPNELFNSTFMIDNFLNSDYDTFIVKDCGTDNAHVTLNPNETQAIDRVEVIVEGDIITVAGIDVRSDPSLTRYGLRLTKGLVELEVQLGAERIEFELQITSDDVNEGTIETTIVTFFDQDNTMLGTAIARVGTLIEEIAPVFQGRSLSGWFTDINEGYKIRYAPKGNIELWARFNFIEISGQTHKHANVTLQLTYNFGDVDVVFDYLRILSDANGNFTFTNPDIPLGEFLLTIELDGHLTYTRQIVIIDGGIINLYNIPLEKVTIKGVTPEFTSVTIMNMIGEVVAELRSTGSTGDFVFEGLLDGSYVLRLEKNGFVPRTINFTINRNNFNFNEYMDEINYLKLDAVTISGTALENTRVELHQNDRIVTYIIVENCGTFIFSAIHTNTPILNRVYVVITLLETFDKQRHTFTITGSASESIEFNQTSLVAISGITSQRTLVTLVQDNSVIDSILSDAFGSFEFTGIKNGNFSLVFERRNFESFTIDVSVNYSSIVMERQLLTRNAPDNSHFGIGVQIILVGLIGTSIWIILFKRKNKEETY